MLLEQNFESLPKEIMVNSNTFRKERMYNREMDMLLRVRSSTPAQTLAAHTLYLIQQMIVEMRITMHASAKNLQFFAL